MRLAVVSDTHGHVQLTRSAITMLESLEVERVLHCGDIGSTEVVEMFAQWPTEFVFGNCDFNHADLQEAIVAAGQTCHRLFGQLEIEGRRIALLHSHDRGLFERSLHQRRVGSRLLWAHACREDRARGRHPGAQPGSHLPRESAFNRRSGATRTGRRRL